MASEKVENRRLSTKIKWARDMVASDFFRNKYVYLMVLPVLAYYVIFHYIPMYGLVIAFKDYSIPKGIIGSPWAGFKYFEQFFNSYYFLRILKNTLSISTMSILLGFPIPIIFAVLLNELRSNKLKRITQTVTYLPHFISLVVVCGLIVDFLSGEGVINDIIEAIGLKRTSFLQESQYFQPIYVLSDIWQNFGWNSIIFIAALCNIDPQLYEASTIDGAGRWKKVWNVTIPGILPTIVVLFILRIGNIMQIGYEKIILLYNEATYETADVISTFVYRKGLQEFNFSYAAAVGMFNTVINFTFLLTANWLSSKVNDTSLW